MNFRYYKIELLISVILLMSAGIDLGIEKLLIPYMTDHNMTFLRAPGNAALIGSFLFFYNNFLWRLPVFNLLVKVPNLNGRYKGKINYEFQGVAGQKDCVVEIIQTASSIKIHSYFDNGAGEKTKSKSLVESIEEEDGFYHLYLYYFNSGSKDTGKLDCHEGANMLKFIPEHEGSPKKLTGHYFTSRKIQTRGEMNVEFESKKIKGTF